jgi:hypothetical protein
LAFCFLFVACAQKAQPLAVHIAENHYQPEHDEVVLSDSITDYYPSRQAPHEIVYHKISGGMIDATCIDAGCRQLSLKIMGSKAIPDGGYQFIQTDDPHVIMVRDYEGVRILGYLAQNNGGGVLRYFSDLQEAQTFEHQGDAGRTAGKIVVGTILVAALAALVGAVAITNANANRAGQR